jgi:anti-sigma regulatory factor (Ser/Thr protein kinase)
MNSSAESSRRDERSDACADASTQPAVPLWTVVLRGGENAPAHARRWARSQLGRVAIGINVDDLALIVSELVTNSVVHAHVDASRALRVSVASLGSRFRITVIDPGSGTEPRLRAADAGLSGGLGLRLVDRLCTDWGTFRDADHARHVWCDLTAAHGSEPALPAVRGRASVMNEAQPLA